MSHPDVFPVSCFHPCLQLKGFKAYRIAQSLTAAVAYGRRDFYKICLITTRSRMYYQEEEMQIDGNVLFFASPQAAYTWENMAPEQSGYSCLFTEDFLNRHPRLASLILSPLLGMGEMVLLSLNQAQQKKIASIFGLILSAQDTHYLFKHELIANYIDLLIHEVLKMQPSENY